MCTWGFLLSIRVTSVSIGDNVKTYRIFGPICTSFYSINTIYYTVFYVYLQVFVD